MEGYAYCTCNAGFFGDGQKYCFPTCGLGYWPDEFTGECINIDECLTMTHDCAIQADCTDNAGSYECACQEGYLGDGKFCADEKGSNQRLVRVFCPVGDRCTVSSVRPIALRSLLKTMNVLMVEVDVILTQNVSTMRVVSDVNVAKDFMVTDSCAKI